MTFYFGIVNCNNHNKNERGGKDGGTGEVEGMLDVVIMNMIMAGTTKTHWLVGMAASKTINIFLWK